jgi:membrane protein required for colicin V production
MLGPLTYLDAALLVIAGLSGLLAMYRGLTRELLSILSWVIGAAATGYFVYASRPDGAFRPQVELLAKQIGAQAIIAQIIAGALIFLVVLTVVHLITTRMSDAILDSNVGMIDRMLGFVFGAVRGFVLVLIPFMFYQEFFPNADQQYAWVKDSKSRPLLERSARTLRPMLERVIEKAPKPGEPQQQG